MGSITFHPHTADEKFSVDAATLEDAFSTAVQACAQIMIGDVKPEPTTQERVIVKGAKLRMVLYDFLNDIIALLDESHTLFHTVDNIRVVQDGDEWLVEATLLGTSADKLAFRTVIKNMTYSEMEILQGNNKVSLTVVVDI